MFWANIRSSTSTKTGITYYRKDFNNQNGELIKELSKVGIRKQQTNHASIGDIFASRPNRAYDRDSDDYAERGKQCRIFIQVL